MMVENKEPERRVLSELLAGVSLFQIREMLRRSVLTLAAVPDPDLRYRMGPRSAWPPFIQEMRDAYGSAPPKVRIFHPTRRDLTIFLDMLAMLSWYKREHSEDTTRLFIAWVFGAAMWDLQERCSTNRRRPASPNTVHNRINGMLLTIAEEFPEIIFQHALDELHELPQNTYSAGHGDKAVTTDARDLPKSRPSWSDPSPTPQSVKEEAAAHKELEKQLAKNKSRAIGRDQKRKRALG